MQSVLAKNIWKWTQKMEKRRPCKYNMACVRSKNETVVLRMIYKKHIKNVPTTSAACGGTGSSVKRSKIGVTQITIGLGRHTTTNNMHPCGTALWMNYHHVL